MLNLDYLEEKRKEKMVSNDRVLVIKPIPGKTTTTTAGLVDPRLFKGENNIHAIMDEGTCLWSMRYDKGILPPVLKQQFTSFSKLYKFAEEYFNKRNLQIVEIRD